MSAAACTAPRAAVHLDMDGGPHIFRAHGWTYPTEEDPLFFSGLQAFLAFFAREGLRATLFVIAEDVHDPAKLHLLEEAVRQGHTIGSHTMSHRRLTDLDREEQRREIFASRELLGEALGGDIEGFRAPGFHLDRGVLELVHDAGYVYDSSLFPGGGRSTGRLAAGEEPPRDARITASKAEPHEPLPGRRLLELPMPAHRPLPLPFHPSYSLVLGSAYFRLGLRRHLRTRAPYVMLFHLTDLADPLPDAMLAGWGQRLYTLSHMSAEQKRSRCERFVELARARYRFGSTREVLQDFQTESMPASQA